jgi:hypothetical protein
MMDFLAHILARLRCGSFTGTLVAPGLLDGSSFWHFCFSFPSFTCRFVSTPPVKI